MNKIYKMQNLTFIGIGRLGLCSALVFEKVGYNVLGVDIFQNYVDQLNKKIYKSHEPYIEEYLQNSKKFYATTNLDKGLNFSDYIFIVVQTPNGGGENFYDHSILSSLLVNINKRKIKNKHFIICCTTMPGYIENIGKTLIEDCENCTINYNPEFIAQGNIIKDFENPDMILIGQDNEKIGKKIEELYKPIFGDNQPKYCKLSLTEAELVKISINGFITTKLSYANMISDACDRLGGNKYKVLNAIGSDSRIGNKYFRPGNSFGGPCFPRDTQALSIVLEKLNLNNDLINSTRKYNDEHNKIMAENILLNLKEKNETTYIMEDVCYKENSEIPIIEESAKLKIAKYLVNKGIEIYIKDKKHMINEVKKEYGNKFKYIYKE